MEANGEKKWDVYLVTAEDPYTPLFMMEVTADTSYHARREWFRLFKETYTVPKGVQIIHLLKYTRVESKEPRKEHTRKEEVGQNG